MDRHIPLVFLHAFPLHSAMWEGQRHTFSTRPVLTPDFPGFGDRSPGPSGLEGFARSVLQQMDREGMERAVFIGLSMGGYVAFRILALAEDRVAGLVLADTRAGPDDKDGKARRTDQAKRVREEGVEWLPDALVPALLGDTTLSERPGVETVVREMIQGAEAEGVARALEAMRDRPDSNPILKAIRVPTLVLVGDEDTLTPMEESETIARRIPGARLEVIPKAGHLSNLEASGAFNHALMTFLEG